MRILSSINVIVSRYFTLRDQASRSHNDVHLESIVSKLAMEVLSALGYPITEHSSKKIEVEPGVYVPVALEINH